MRKIGVAIVIIVFAAFRLQPFCPNKKNALDKYSARKFDFHFITTLIFPFRIAGDFGRYVIKGFYK